MKRIVGVLVVVPAIVFGAIAAERIPGDIDGDGKVGFPDFLILAKNFGRTGGATGPDTARVTVYDTVRTTVHDTVSVWPSGESVNPLSGPDQLTIASFNIRIFSSNSRDDAELEQIVIRLEQFDLVAIQELRDAEILDRALVTLDGRGHAFQASVSEPVGRITTERYAFIWRKNKVEQVGSAKIWDDQGDQFIREPYIASFRSGSFDFTLITIHSIYGDSKAEGRAEAMLMDDVFQATQDADPNEQDVIVLGDFNLEPEDTGFSELGALLSPLFTGDIRTTITETSLYDNIWIHEQHTGEYTGQYGMDRFDQTAFGNDDDAASLAVSDRRPVWAKFSTDGADDD